MYCPKCAELNSDDVKYCRTCGENLSVVALAMKRKLPITLLDKMDRYLQRKNERLRRDSIVSAMSGLGFLLLGLYDLFKGDKLSFNVVFPLVVGILMLIWSGWDYLVYQRSLSSGSDAREVGKAAGTGEMLAHDSSQERKEMTSVTEATTKKLDMTRTRSGQEEKASRV